MTDIKAINELDYLLGYEKAVDEGYIEGENHLNSEEKEALKFILDEIRQYRAIGTVKELKSMKENGAFTGVELAQIAVNQMKLKKYMEIGTVEEFKDLKDKSVAKKPEYEGDGYYNGQIVLDTWICPNCEKHYEIDYDDYDFCPNCGQHIDHSGLTEDD